MKLKNGRIIEGEAVIGSYVPVLLQDLTPAQRRFVLRHVSGEKLSRLVKTSAGHIYVDRGIALV